MIKVIRALWELLRLEHGLMFFLAVLSGAFISLSDVRSISIEDLIFSFFTVLFLEASTFALNDFYDIDIDRRNNRFDRPLVRGDISPKVALFLFYVLFPAGLLFSFFVNILCFIIAIITGFLGVLYDARLKKMKIIGNFYIAYAMAIPFVFGSVSVTGGNKFSLSVLLLAFIAFVAGSAREIMKDIMDYRGDSSGGVVSFPSYLGIDNSKKLVAILYLIAILFSFIPFLFKLFVPYYFNWYYLSFVIVADILFIFTIYEILFDADIDFVLHRKTTLFSIFIGLVAFLAGSIFY